MAWLYFEVLSFYLNIIAIAGFLMLSSCKKYRTIRERSGHGQALRSKLDFLTYCREDIHWYSIWFTQLLLSVLCLHMRIQDLKTIQVCVAFLFLRHVLEFLLLATLYYSAKFEFSLFTQLLFAATVILNFVLIKFYRDLDRQHIVWWAPALLQDIVLHFYIFVMIAIEWASWEKTEARWRLDAEFQAALDKDQDNYLNEKETKLKVELEALSSANKEAKSFAINVL